MSKEILEQLKIGDKVWAEVYVISEMDKQGDIQVEGYSYEVKDSMFLNHTNNFSLSAQNELTVRELIEFVKEKGYGNGDYDAVLLYNDFSGGSRDGVIDFNSLDQLTKLVRDPNFQRKEEIRKQIEELEQELKKL